MRPWWSDWRRGSSVLSQKYVGIREPMHPILRRCSSVEDRPVDMRPPRALQDARLGPLGASTYFWDRTLAATGRGAQIDSGLRDPPAVAESGWPVHARRAPVANPNIESRSSKQTPNPKPLGRTSRHVGEKCGIGLLCGRAPKQRGCPAYRPGSLELRAPSPKRGDDQLTLSARCPPEIPSVLPRLWPFPCRTRRPAGSPPTHPTHQQTGTRRSSWC